MKKVWVVHRKKTNNLGDSLIGKGIKSLLEKFDLEVRRCELKGKNLLLPIISILFYLPRLRREKPKGIFIGGGQLLLPTRSFLASLMIWTLMAKISRFKLIIFSVGTERRNGKYPKIYAIILKFVLAQSDIVRLRDKHSQKLVKNLTGQTYPVVPDVAYGLDYDQWKKKEKKDIFICPVKWDAVEIYGQYSTKKAYFEDFIKEIKKDINGDDIIYIFSTTKTDKEAMKNLFRYIKNNTNFEDVFIIITEEEDILLDVLGRARRVIGGRMHSTIIGHLLGADAITIDQNKKIKNFSQNFLSSTPEKLGDEVYKSLSKIIDQEF